MDFHLVTCLQKLIYQNLQWHRREGTFMNDLMKGLVIMAVLMYIVSPIDAAPGPIDDIIVLLLGLASRKRLADND